MTQAPDAATHDAARAPARLAARAPERLSVAVLTWEYPPATSGLPRAAREVAQALAEAGQDVRVLTLDRDGHERDGAVELVGRRIDPASALGALRRRAAIGHLAAPIAFRRLLREEHARRPFDIAEATNWFAPGLLVALLGPVPLVTRNSTPATIGRHARASMRDRLDGGFVDRIERRAARAGAAMISNTPAHAEPIRRFYRLEGWDGIHKAVAPPVDPALIEVGASASHPDGEGNDTPIRFLFVGRPDHRKGFDTIADALARIAAMPDAPELVLSIVGSTREDLPETLREGPAARLVRPLGRLDDAALRAEFERAHAVLAPSRSESFGYVYQEAMAFGRPLVACAEDASARSFVGEPGAGLLAERCRGEDVAEAMLRLASDRELRATLRTNALGAAGRCTREACATGTLAVYRRVLAVYRRVLAENSRV